MEQLAQQSAARQPDLAGLLPLLFQRRRRPRQQRRPPPQPASQI